MNDPRWQRLLDFVAWTGSDEAARNRDEFARRFRDDYLAVAEAIAADPAVPVRARARARKIVTDFDRTLRAETPALLAATAKLIRDPNIAAAERAEFAELLARAVERLPAASDSRH